MNLKAYTYTMYKNNPDKPLFGRICKNKADARKVILNHGMLSAVDWVEFKGKKFTIGEVYKWA